MPAPRLHDYQHVALKHLHRNPKAALMLDMGLGKTAVTLSSLTADHLPVLVTAPKRVAENVWEHEARIWRPDLSVRVAKGTPAQRLDALRSGADVVVIGRDNLKDATGAVSRRFRTLVLDEMSGFKARQSIRWRSAKKITASPSIKHVWGLTGTPSPNGLLDLWAQMYLLDGGLRLGSTLTEYRTRYFTPGRQLANGVITEWLLRPGMDKKIHSLLEDICLSMESEGRITLPPVTFNKVSVPLPPTVRKLYKTLKDDLVVDLDMLGGEIHSAKNAATLSGKLSQLAAGFLYVDDADLREGKYDKIHTEKIQAVQEIVNGTGSPVLVFYRFKAEKEMLLKAFEGNAATMDEDNIIERWNAGKVPVLLAHPASAGHGLNLQSGGHTAIWTTLPWSLEEWEQANARLARQGQKNPVVIHVLLSPKTLDAHILKALETKASVQDALLAHLESPL